MTLEDEIKVFLVDWVNSKQIPNVRPGMSEDLLKFVTDVLASNEAHRSAEKMKAQSEGKNLPEQELKNA